MDLSGVLNFIDQICLEDEFYCVIESLNAKSKFELQWQRKNATQPWRVRSFGSSNWHHIKTIDLPDLLMNESIDSEKFYHELSSFLLTQAVYARTLVKGVDDIYGKERVDEAEKATQLFIEKIKAMAVSNGLQAKLPTNTLDKKNERGLRLLREKDL
jgi:hypothetical protein